MPPGKAAGSLLAGGVERLCGWRMDGISPPTLTMWSERCAGTAALAVWGGRCAGTAALAMWSERMAPPTRAGQIEQAMRRHGGAVYVVALAQTRSREDACYPELARFSAAREADC